MNFPQNFFVVLIAIFLVSCVTDTQKRESASIDGKHANGLAERLYAPDSGLSLKTFPNSPVFLINRESGELPKRNLMIFISLSCNYCEKLTLDTWNAVTNKSSLFENVQLGFAVIPRRIADVAFTAGLMCVGAKDFPKALVGYYEIIRGENGRRAIDRNLMALAYEQTLERFNVSNSERRKCENSDVMKREIANLTLLAVNKRTENKVPVVIYDGDYYSFHLFSDLENLMRWKS